MKLELERQRPFRQAELQENFGVIEWVTFESKYDEPSMVKRGHANVTIKVWFQRRHYLITYIQNSNRSCTTEGAVRKFD